MNFLKFYQSIPSHINPELFQIGFLSIRWYSLGYILAFLTVLGLVYWRISKKEFDLEKLPKNKIEEIVLDVFLVSIFSMMLGARLGYFLFYDWQTIFSSPWSIFIPGKEGFFGFSFHGGLIGASVGVLIYTKLKNFSFKALSNLFIPAIPLGLFWGRLGNFFNGELWGKKTTQPWGMYSEPNNPFLNHPSQLYEALGEGVLIFIILWKIRNKKWAQDNFLSLFLILYGSIRFLIEFFRVSPPEHVVFETLTIGQVLCLGMIMGGIYLFKFQSSNYFKLIKSKSNDK